MTRPGDEKGCPFCDFIRSGRPLAERGTVVAMPDLYPVSLGHTLLVPKRHVETVFALTQEEREDLFQLLLEMRDLIQRHYNPDGFNVGVNIGAAAGQTIAHVHVHIIPRYAGDVENPTGGVRGVIPGRADYRSAHGDPGESSSPASET